MTRDLTVTLVQSDLVWHDIDKNLSAFGQKIQSIKEDTDLIILPEMFTTGFSMNAEELSEGMGGSAICLLYTSPSPRDRG